MCCDERTWRQRGLLIMKHTGPKLQHWERRRRKKRNEWLESQLNITGERHSLGDMQEARYGVKTYILKTMQQKGGETIQEEREEKRESGIPTPLLCFALLLTRTGGGTSNCTWKRIRKGREDESLFIYAFNLPKDLTLPHSSDSGGRESLRAVLQNKGLL